ncbi:MAG: PD-(D/E)XK nuclease family transposase [Thiomargarita sp.]|nr:PD-(D/E)XK nuclease family transposase [Thiomargarita sp.]
MKDKYINPFTDFGFKKLFGTELNKDILIDFLNELLRKEQGKIVDLTYLSNEHLGRAIEDRKAIFDIYCENEKGEKFIVEMQKAKQNYFKDRSIYYSTFPIQEQAQKGNQWNFKLKAIYTIGILDFIFDDDKKDKEVFHHVVQLFNKQTQKIFYNKLTYIYLEMPKFTKSEAELETHFDKWLFVLKNLSNFNSRPTKLQNKVFKHLFEQAKIANYSDKEYSEYETSLKVYRDLKNSIDTAFSDGKIEGKTEGKVEGIIEGIIEGKVEGKVEGSQNKQIEIAKLMKQASESIEKIIKYTGLTRTEIENL